MGTLDGKIAIVTGAGRSIGRGIALALAAEGAAIAVAERHAENGEATATLIREAGGRAMFCPVDIRASAAVDAFVAATVAQFGTVDILVNNAMAADVRVPLEQTTDESIALALAAGPMATFYFMRACHQHLVGGGRVINLRSGSEIQGLAGFASYVAAKAAVGGLTRCAAREWGGQGINVNAIAPFSIGEATRRHFDEHPEDWEHAMASLSIKRTGDAQADIGRVAVFLAGPDSSYVTGVTIPVDGGGSFFA